MNRLRAIADLAESIVLVSEILGASSNASDATAPYGWALLPRLDYLATASRTARSAAYMGRHVRVGMVPAIALATFIVASPPESKLHVWADVPSWGCAGSIKM